MAIMYVGLVMTIVFHQLVQADYPPPSEDGHRYYSRRSESGSSFVGTGRVSSSFGSLPDWTGSDWGSLNAGGHGSARCVSIPSNLSLCRNMEYSQMRLPNLLEHDTLREVSQQSSSWVRLLDVRCHADTQVFLCSLFAPVCLDRPVWPCRSLCEAVKSGCEDRMLRYGFPWPDMLRCDQYPLDDDLCIGLRSSSIKGSDVALCPACSQSETYENIVDHFCSSDVVMRIKVEQTVISGDELKVVANRRRKLYKTTSSLKPKDAREITMFIEAGARCDCSALDQSSPSTNYLVMGHKVLDRLAIDSVISLGQRSKEISRAMRTIRARNICHQSSKLTASSTAETTATGGSRSRKLSRNKERKRRPVTSPMSSVTTMTSIPTPKSRRTNGRAQPTGSRRHQKSAKNIRQ